MADDKFNIFYRKNKNNKLFSILEKDDVLDIENPQNYIPIYDNFFELNETNWNSINLNHKWAIDNIVSKKNDNKFTANIVDVSNNIKKTDIFFKFSPLLDPLKYIIGKYEKYNDTIYELPKITDNTCISKTLDKNNVAYTDGFFYYLTSCLLHNEGFIHGIDYYGGFLCNKNNFKFDVADDIEYIDKSNYFHKNRGTLFDIDNSIDLDLIGGDSRNYKKKINISNKSNIDIATNDINELTFDNIFQHNMDLSINNIDDISINVIYNDSIEENDNDNIDISNIDLSNNSNYNSESESDCSSREISDDEAKNNDSDNESDDEDDDDDDDDDDEWKTDDNDDSSTDSDVVINANINKFPINIICLEALENTLDKLMVDDELDNAEWCSAFMQIIMMLITYQKTFNMTHNDLHTNNVMYVTTEKQYIYYCYDSKYYRVPTYGKLYKIIDFGRAIYKFKGKTICSDSFSKSGDASSQYNCDPYFNPNKPRLEPNYSFDLCRLACSMFDYFIDDLDNIEQEMKEDPIARIVVDWCKDDKGRNILYKQNGDERYPDFKLYKMIARNVHKHTPHAQLDTELCSKYQVTKKSINKKMRIINIDKMQSYT